MFVLETPSFIIVLFDFVLFVHFSAVSNILPYSYCCLVEVVVLAIFVTIHHLMLPWYFHVDI